MQTSTEISRHRFLPIIQDFCSERTLTFRDFRTDEGGGERQARRPRWKINMLMLVTVVVFKLLSRVFRPCCCLNKIRPTTARTWKVRSLSLWRTTSSADDITQFYHGNVMDKHHLMNTRSRKRVMVLLFFLSYSDLCATCLFFSPLSLSLSLSLCSPTWIAFAYILSSFSFSRALVQVLLFFMAAVMMMTSLYIRCHFSSTPLLHHADDKRRREAGEDQEWWWWLHSLSSRKIKLNHTYSLLK